MVQRRSSIGIAVSVPRELFREMLRVYRIYRETGPFESLQLYGAAQARQRGIRDEEDVERLIAEARGE